MEAIETKTIEQDGQAYRITIYADEDAGNPLKVWPNPCQGLLYAAHGTAAVPWQVQDAVGRIACSGTLDPSGLIEVQALAPGAYVLTVGHAPPVRFVKE